MYRAGTEMDPVSLAVAVDDKAQLPALPDLGSEPTAAASHGEGLGPSPHRSPPHRTPARAPARTPRSAAVCARRGRPQAATAP
ncbi:hypothetical protein SMICM304S_00016 [Streptomyces microflavus]